jgi:hypothetical protein
MNTSQNEQGLYVSNVPPRIAKLARDLGIAFGHRVESIRNLYSYGDL